MGDRQQHLHIQIPSDLPALTSDLQYFQRILAELLQNACKFTPAGGVITICLAEKLDGGRSPRLYMRVSNSGIEIPAVELPRIFEKFYRIPSSDPWKYEGTGLGLALVERLVKCLQGDIEAQSANGQTCLIVSLPFCLAEVPPPLVRIKQMQE